MHKKYKYLGTPCLTVSYNDGCYVSEPGGFKFPKWIVENSKEWEKIDLGWEIISLTDGFNVYFKTSNGKFTINTAREYDLDALLKSNDINILAVKRTKDNKVFRIYDYIASPLLGKITYFSINEDGSLELCNKNGYVDISKIKRVEESLLTTKDQVEIYPGDEFYYIGDAYNVCKTKLISGEKWNSKLIAFADEKIAIKYAEENRPEYKITRIRYKNKKALDTLDKLYEDIIDLKGVFNPDKMVILEIKRISDGQLFKLGDKIVSADIINTIEHFEFLASGELRIKCSNAYLDINSLKKTEMITMDKSILLKMLNECADWQTNLSTHQRTQITLEEAKNQKISTIFAKYKPLNV